MPSTNVQKTRSGPSGASLARKQPGELSLGPVVDENLVEGYLRMMIVGGTPGTRWRGCALRAQA
jgi:hypothetical protein